MAIKRVGQPPAAAPAPTGLGIKRVEPRAQDDTGGGDRFDKSAAVGHLVLVELVEYDSEYPGNYGKSPRAIVHITDIDAGSTVYRDAWIFSTLASQVARDLAPGEKGLGRICTGKTKSGGDWYGFEFTLSDIDWNRAEKALTDAEIPF